MNRAALVDTLVRLDEAGFEVETVSVGGGTPASMQAQEVPELTEIRVGTYIFNDVTQIQGRRDSR